MRLRVALRRLRHAAGLSDDEEKALLAQCKTVEALALTTDFARLAKSVGGKVEACTLQHLAAELVGSIAPRYTVASEIFKTDGVLETGLAELDWLLGGGFATGEVTELLGSPATGKSQVCLLACAARVALPHGGGVLYFDTGCNYRAERVYKLAQLLATRSERVDCRSRLDERMRAVPTTTLSEMVQGLDMLDYQLQQAHADATDAADAAEATGATDDCAHAAVDDGLASSGSHHGAASAFGSSSWLRSLRLVVVDSAFGALAAEQGGEGRSTTHGSQQARLQALLRSVAIRHRIAVVVTNGVATASSTAADVAASEPRPLFGHAWSHVAHTRLLLRTTPLSEPNARLAASDGEDWTGATTDVQLVKCQWSLRNVVRSAEGAVRVHFSANGRITAERV